MTPLEILQVLDEIKSTSRKKLKDNAKGQLGKLFDDIKGAYGENGSIYLKQLVSAYGLAALLEEDNISLELEPYYKHHQHQSVYNHELYQKIMPLCQLAYLHEKNGTPEEHAFKLSVIFKDQTKIFDYLLHFGEQNSYRYFLHDACLFDLPESDSCDFKQWKEFANQGGTTALKMHNPRFREILPHAQALEQMIRKDKGQFAGKINYDKIKAKEDALLKKSREYKNTLRSPLKGNPTEAQKNVRDKKLASLKQEQSLLYLELAELTKGCPLKQFSVPMLQALYERYQLESNEAHQILVKHGINAANIALFHQLERDNDDAAIPNIIIDGKDIGYPGCYLTKLDTLSDKGAALAACLGKITNCCQYLGGPGAECAKHGISSKNGGFYVLWQGDAANPCLDDRILSQAWVWRSQSKGLCLDSIEIILNGNKNQTSDMFRYLGFKLCNDYGITQVNTGGISGITLDVGFTCYLGLNMQTIDYSAYRDSDKQLRLADKDVPCLFYNNNHSETFNNIIKKSTDNYFKSLLSTEVALKDNEALKKMIFKLIDLKLDSLISLLQDAAAQNDAQALSDLININREYLHGLSHDNPDFDALEQGAYIDSVDKAGTSALHLAIGDSELLKYVLEFYPTEEHKLEALKMADRSGTTVLHDAAYFPESLKLVLGLYPTEEQRLEALNIADKYGKTVRDYAANKPESLEIINQLTSSITTNPIKGNTLSSNSSGLFHHKATTSKHEEEPKDNQENNLNSKSAY